MASATDKAAPVNVSLEDLEYALSLLETEGGGKAKRGLLVRQIIIYIGFALFFMTCPIGLLVVWFDRLVGIVSLVLAVICAAIFFIFVFTGDVDPAEKIFSQLKETRIGELAKKSYDQHSNTFFTFYGCLLIPAFAVGIAGIIWFIVDLINLKHVTYIPLALIALPFLILGIFTGVMTFREYAFYNQVLQVSDRFQQVKKEASEKKEAQVSLSASDVELLSKVETMKAQRSIAQVQSNIQNWFAVVIGVSASAFLNRLKEKAPDDYYEIRDAIDSLQENPRPQTAVGMPDQANAFKLAIPGHYIFFKRDDDKQRIEILKITNINGAEA